MNIAINSALSHWFYIYRPLGSRIIPQYMTSEYNMNQNKWKDDLQLGSDYSTEDFHPIYHFTDFVALYEVCGCHNSTYRMKTGIGQVTSPSQSTHTHTHCGGIWRKPTWTQEEHANSRQKSLNSRTGGLFNIYLFCAKLKFAIPYEETLWNLISVENWSLLKKTVASDKDAEFAGIQVLKLFNKCAFLNQINLYSYLIHR